MPNISGFPWAENRSKLSRAIEEAGEKGTEAQIKEIYARLLGKVVEVKEEEPKKKVSKKK